MKIVSLSSQTTIFTDEEKITVTNERGELKLIECIQEAATLAKLTQLTKYMDTNSMLIVEDLGQLNKFKILLTSINIMENSKLEHKKEFIELITQLLNINLIESFVKTNKMTIKDVYDLIIIKNNNHLLNSNIGKVLTIYFINQILDSLTNHSKNIEEKYHHLLKINIESFTRYLNSINQKINETLINEIIIHYMKSTLSVNDINQTTLNSIPKFQIIKLKKAFDEIKEVMKYYFDQSIEPLFDNIQNKLILAAEKNNYKQSLEYLRKSLPGEIFSESGTLKLIDCLQNKDSRHKLIKLAVGLNIEEGNSIKIYCSDRMLGYSKLDILFISLLFLEETNLLDDINFKYIYNTLLSISEINSKDLTLTSKNSILKEFKKKNQLSTLLRIYFEYQNNIKTESDKKARLLTQKEIKKRTNDLLNESHFKTLVDLSQESKSKLMIFAKELSINELTNLLEYNETPYQLTQKEIDEFEETKKTKKKKAKRKKNTNKKLNPEKKSQDLSNTNLSEDLNKLKQRIMKLESERTKNKSEIEYLDTEINHSLVQNKKLTETLIEAKQTHKISWLKLNEKRLAKRNDS